MDRHRLAGRLDRLPHRIVLRQDRETAIGIALQQEGHEPRHFGNPLDLGQAFLGAAIGQQGRAAQPRRVGGAEFRHEIVIGAHHVVMQVRVLACADEGGRIVRTEYQLGIDAVLIELRETGLGIVAAGVDVGVAAPGTHGFRIAPGAGAIAERNHALKARKYPGIALLERFDPRHPVPVLRSHPRGPNIGRLVQMTVRRNQPVGSTIVRHGTAPPEISS